MPIRLWDGTRLLLPTIDAGPDRVQARGAGTRVELFDAASDTTTTVASAGDDAPGGGRFGGFYLPVVDGDDVAFTARLLDTTDGLFAPVDGQLRRLAGEDTPIPGGAGTFTGFETRTAISLDDGSVAFVGLGDDSQRGLYLFRDGDLMKIVDRSDLLDGRSIFSLEITPQSLVGDRIAFQALFTDQTSGIYRATVPEPAALGLAGIALAARRRRRRSRTSAHR